MPLFAIVTINGQQIGTVWTAPWRIEVSEYLRSGQNLIEIEVINTWVNRIIGVLHGGADTERDTTVVMDHVTAETALLSAGLLGPVKLEVE